MSGMIGVAIFCALVALGVHYLVKSITMREEMENQKPKILG